MMYGFLSYKQMASFKAGDSFVCFLARELVENGGREIEGKHWFEPGHNHGARSFAEAAKELFRLRDRFLGEFPGLHLNLDQEKGMGRLFLPCNNGRIILLAFQSNILTTEQLVKLQAMVRGSVKPKEGEKENESESPAI